MELYPTKYEHVFMMDVSQRGVLEECAILNKFKNGDIAFFKISSMDIMDRQRLLKIITHRNAKMMVLWDLMKGITLKNGANALDYFHQYCKVMTANGVIMQPRAGQAGISLMKVQSAPVADATESVQKSESVVKTKAKA